MDIHKFIKQRPCLIWHVKDLDGLSEEAIMEAVLNYGNFKDVKKLISILGIGRAAEIFRKQIKKKRCNYHPEVKNYFNLYFQKYARSSA